MKTRRQSQPLLYAKAKVAGTFREIFLDVFIYRHL